MVIPIVVAVGVQATFNEKGKGSRSPWPKKKENILKADRQERDTLSPPS
jgi:hypothetical protein